MIILNAGLAETPDLLRRPAGELMPNDEVPTGVSTEVRRSDLNDLHLRAFRSCSSQFSEVYIYRLNGLLCFIVLNSTRDWSSC